MQITQIKISEIKPYAKNPRRNAKAVDAVANSIKEFGFKVPVIIDGNGEIVAGHTRLLAAQKLGLTEIPCVIADDLTERQIKAFRLADNKTHELSEWDFDLLEAELENMFDFDMSDFGFDLFGGMDSPKSTSEYTKKIKSPQYDITGEKVEITDLAKQEKYNELIQEINKSGLPEEQKTFLRLAAGRHVILDFHKIAEYYAGTDKEMQNLMEKSALVIIDFDDAIKNGYVKLSKTIDKIMEEDEGIYG